MATELSVDSLPDEVLELIFSKLTLPELKSARLVCKHWLKVSNSWSITRHELIKIGTRDLHLFRTPRACLNIKIVYGASRPTDFKKHEKFWVVHGSSVRSLTVKALNHLSSIVHSIINYCCNVRHLVLKSISGTSDDCDDVVGHVIVVGAQLGCLLSLTFKTVSHVFVAGPAFSRLVESVPNLKRLAWSCFTRDNLCEGPVMSLIVNQADTLTELRLNGCWFASDFFLEGVFEIIGPQLTGLYLEGLPLDNVEFLIKQADKLPNLEGLEVSRMQLNEGKGNSLYALVRFKKLKSISLYHTSFCDEDFLPLEALENLKGLDISGMLTESIADEILNCFQLKAFPNLIALKMQYLNSVTDEVLATVMPHLPNLKCIALTSCYRITQKGVTAIVTNCKQLTHLILQDCCGIDNFVESGSLSHDLPKLKYLHMGECDINSEGLQQIVAHCQQLTHLSLERSSRYYESEEPDYFLDLQSTIFEPADILQLRFENLKTITLVGICEPEGGFYELFKNCPRLECAFLNSLVLKRSHNEVVKRPHFDRPDPFYFNIFDF